MADIVIAWRRAVKLQPVLVLLFCVVCACRCCGACGTSSDVLVGALDTHTHTHTHTQVFYGPLDFVRDYPDAFSALTL